jgi:hypothetical protein
MTGHTKSFRRLARPRGEGSADHDQQGHAESRQQHQRFGHLATRRRYKVSARQAATLLIDAAEQRLDAQHVAEAAGAVRVIHGGEQVRLLEQQQRGLTLEQ